MLIKILFNGDETNFDSRENRLNPEENDGDETNIDLSGQIGPCIKRVEEAWLSTLGWPTYR